MKNKFFLITLTLGLTVLLLSGLGIYFSFKKDMLDSSIYYQIGKITSTKGFVKKILSNGEKLNPKNGEELYSHESFKIGKNSHLKIQIAQDHIKITGPASFSFNLVDPNTKEVFINFSEFTSVEPKKTTYTNIKLTYKGWLIEPFFSKKDLEKNTEEMISLPPVLAKNSPTQESPLGQLSEKERESYLVEIISLKRPLLKKCYENYLKKNPLAKGKLMVEFTLQNTGRVSSSKIKDSSFFKDELFKNCIQDVFRRVKSRPFSGDPILIAYPIEFE